MIYIGPGEPEALSRGRLTLGIISNNCGKRGVGWKKILNEALTSGLLLSIKLD